MSSRVLTRAVELLDGTVRQGQETMRQLVSSTLDDKTALMVQAGTGTGKSLAYLVPAMVWAKDNNATVVISTATLALQRQLITHDIPIAAQAYHDIAGSTVTYEVLKGWSNYICLNKTRTVVAGPDEDESLWDVADDRSTHRADDIVRLRQWAEETDTGDRDDLVPGVDGKTWHHVSVSTRECLKDKCDMWDECFAHAAKQRADNADIVVTNHAMLGVEATLPVSVLPHFDALIVDEAHELVDRIRSQSAYNLSQATIDRVVRTVMRDAQIDAAALSSTATDLDKVLRAYDAQLLNDIPTDIRDVLTMLDTNLRTVASAIIDQQQGLTGSDDTSELMAFKRASTAVSELDDTISHISAAQGTTHAMWISDEDDVSLHVAPLSVGAAIVDRLVSERPVIFTSATLRVGNSFDVFATDVGAHLMSADYSYVDVGSPFDFSQQGILYCARHLPPPGRSGLADETLEEIKRLIDASDGGALCLFSSRAALVQAADYLQAHDDQRDYFVQGDDHLPRLIDDFNDDPLSCLMGTMSLWQGVDLPGMGCRLVIIDRIPFARPDDPLMQALNRQAAARGANGFMTVAIPSAAIKLAQGVGRLIRSTDDRGVAAVLDSRLATRRYGNLLRQTLPPMWTTADATTVYEALARLRKTLNQ